MKILELHQLYTIAIFNITFENGKEGSEIGAKAERIVTLIMMFETFASSR